MKDLAYKFICLAIVLVLFSSSYAAKLEKLPFMSDVHLGAVYGLGLGLNIGAGAWVTMREVIKIGGEIEQAMTDYNYTANINWTRFGGIIGYDFGDFNVNWHVGALSFTPSRTVAYTDMSGNTHNITENINYKGSYWGISADFPAGEFTLSPKYMVISPENMGSISEIDLNLGKSF